METIRKYRKYGLFLLLFAATASSLVTWWLMSRLYLKSSKLELVKSNFDDVHYVDNPLKVQWNYWQYNGTVQIYFMVDSLGHIKQSLLAEVTNNALERNLFEWPAYDILKYIGKRGWIAVRDKKGKSKVESSSFIIKKKTLGNQFVGTDFNREGSGFKIISVDTIYSDVVKGLVFDKNRMPLGATNEMISSTKFTIDQKRVVRACKSINSDKCIGNFVTFSTDSLIVTANNYIPAKIKPKQTIYTGGTGGCECSPQEISRVISVIDNGVRKINFIDSILRYQLSRSDLFIPVMRGQIIQVEK